MNDEFSISDYNLFQTGAISSKHFRENLGAYKDKIDNYKALLKEPTIITGPVADSINEIIDKIGTEFESIQSAYDKIAIKLTDIFEHYRDGDKEGAEKLINGLVTDTSIGAQSDSSTLTHTPNTGTGTDAAPNAVAAKAVDWAKSIATDDSYGYINGGMGNGGYDCTQFVQAAYNQAGIDLSERGNHNQTTIVEYLTGKGFSWHPGTINPSELQAGDILVNQVHHAEMYIGNGQKIGAHNDWDGMQGDSRGDEISIDPYSEYGNGGWDGYLRYEGK